MASFFFFRTITPLVSSDVMAYYQPALGRTAGIPERDQIRLYKFFAGTSKEQVLDKGIRSELVHCLQCLLSGDTEP